MSTVLITGITGLVGLNLTRKLSQLDSVERIIGVSTAPNLLKFKEISQLGRKVTIYYGDIKYFDFIDRIISKNNVSKVFHLAAYSTIQNAENSPIRTYEVNTQGTWNVLESSRQNKSVQSVVISTTDKVYGHLNNEELPYKENSRFNPVSTYEVSKACADFVTRSYGKNLGVNTCVVRCSNIFGSRDFNTIRIIPYVILCLLKGMSPIIRNPNFIREFIYVDDVVNNIMKLSDLENFGECYNIGSGVFYQIGEIVKLIAEKLDITTDIKIDSSLNTTIEIDKQFLDFSKLSNLLGNNYSNMSKFNFMDCLDKTIQWYKEFEKTYNFKPE